MKYGVAGVVVAIALAMPSLGQHGGGHGGGAGHAGSAGHAGFAGHSGFSAQAPHSGGGITRPGFSRPSTPMRPGLRVPNRSFGQYRPPYRPGFGDHNRGRDRDRDRDRWRRGWYGGAYAYPGWPAYWYPYPYDPGFYDWGDNGDNGYDQNSAANDSAPYSDYGSPYPDTPQEPYGPQPPYGQAPYPAPPYAQAPAPGMTRPAYPGPAAASPAPPEEPLTLIFKDGRAPQTMRNYVMNPKELTDMDPQHFQRIPLDQIDIAATVQINHAHGVDFEVPNAMRD